jgi:hypothetical protein
MSFMIYALKDGRKLEKLALYVDYLFENLLNFISY